MKKFTSRQGFTLIEMLIVVAVIGILASAVLVGLGPLQRQGRDSRRLGDMRQVQNALELYYNKNGAYPDTTGADNWGTMKAALVPSITSNIPEDPRGTGRYHYGSDGNSYMLMATLEEGDNPALNNDGDTDKFGVACGDASGANHYCVSL